MVRGYRSAVRVTVERGGAASTARGGVVLVFELLATRRVLAGLPRLSGSPSQGWSDGQMILAVPVLNMAGLDRVSDIEVLEADRGLCALVRRFEPKLFGVSRGSLARRFRGGRERCFPSARSRRRAAPARGDGAAGGKWARICRCAAGGGGPGVGKTRQRTLHCVPLHAGGESRSCRSSMGAAGPVCGGPSAADCGTAATGR